MVQERTSRPFQEVPSYIRRTPGKYPPGTIGHFASRGPSIAGTPWEGQTQLQDDSPSDHALHRELKIEPATDGGRIGAAIGYTEADEVGIPYLVEVLFGTVTMQPRPFLSLALDDAGPGFAEIVTDAMLRGLR